MKKIVFATVLFLGFAQASQAQSVVLTGATIIDGNGGAPVRDGVIVIKDKRIVAVGPKTSVSVPGDAREVKLNGKYVLPGLMDGNVHLIPWPSWTYIEFLARYENNFDGLIQEAAQIAFKHDFTTFFDPIGQVKQLLRLRVRI